MNKSRIEQIARECNLFFNCVDKSGKPCPPPDDAIYKFATVIVNEALEDAARECIKVKPHLLIEGVTGPWEVCAAAIRRMKV